MIDLRRIKADIERMQCPYHYVRPQLNMEDGTLEIASSCCDQFKKLILVNLARLIGDSSNAVSEDHQTA